MTVTLPGGLTAEGFAALSLKDQFKLVARLRIAQGLPPYQDATQTVEFGDTETVRESASLSDMPNILGNAIYRKIDDWFQSYRPAWMDYARQEELVDYRPLLLAFISRMQDAKEIREEREIQDSNVSDKGFTLALKAWARQITLPFKIVENDDKGFVARIPDMMIEAAERTMQKIVVRNTLEANPNAYDGAAIFTSGRGNLVTGGGSTLTAANIQAGIATVQSATGDADLNLDGSPLNVPPQFLLVPTSLQFTAAQILNSVTLIAAGTAGTVTQLGNQNPLRDPNLGFKAPLTIVVERYLTNQTAWYILPAKQYSPVVVGLRQGRGLKPRLWQNAPQRQAIRGGSSDDYLLSVSDIVYGMWFDLGVSANNPFSSVKYAGA